MGGGRGLVQGWFEVRHPEPGIVTIAEPLHDEQVRSYLVLGSARAALIDTGMGVGDVRALVRDHSPTDLPLIVVQSHAHWDHVGGTASFAGEAEVWIHAAEADDLARGVANERMRRYLAPDRLWGPLPAGFDVETATIPPARATRLLNGSETLDLGDRALEVIHAPGHSPGGIVLLDRANGVLFSTDVAYPSALYAHTAGADFAAYRRTMAMLAGLAPVLRVVYPAHDETPMDPALLPRMASGLEEIAAGRAPDSTAGDVARHEFEGFAVLVPAAGVVAA